MKVWVFCFFAYKKKYIASSIEKPGRKWIVSQLKRILDNPENQIGYIECVAKDVFEKGFNTYSSSQYCVLEQVEVED